MPAEYAPNVLGVADSRGGREANSRRDCHPAFANQTSLRCSLNSAGAYFRNRSNHSPSIRTPSLKNLTIRSSIARPSVKQRPLSAQTRRPPSSQRPPRFHKRTNRKVRRTTC